MKEIDPSECDIEGDLAPIAVWGSRQPDRRWDNSLLPHYRTGQVHDTRSNIDNLGGFA